MARTLAGQVIDITPKGVLVRAPRMFPIGTHLVNARNQPAGRITDVLGPVSAPYLLVKPSQGAKGQTLLKQDLYTP